MGEGTEYEKIPELTLVIIITQNNDPSNYGKLSQIAPTIVYPYLTFKNVKEEMYEVGKSDTESPIWTNLEAVKNNQVMFPDPNRF
ncbi:ABC transporter substrate-binding protein [Bacillus sp. SD075]|uniref:ABC transporter substrate-binding protein n=1 Tax=Bacillus sp. SD075 TaxID=2781732 RepID=UPI001A97B981|nr:ABC transporter substrate-binding protein [Bacillus sp. SD075]MBO0999728.1 ABC transporter substrate-binding protein [Bacillus sp. SD075]